MPPLQFKGSKTEKQGKKSESYKDRLEIFRPANCILAALTVIAAFKLVAPLDWRAFFAAISVALAAAGGNAINDFFDRNRDMINKPWRPIPSGRIEPELVLGATVVLFGLSIVFSAFVNQTLILIVFETVVTLVIYSGLIKEYKIIGNLIISILMGLVFVIGTAAAGNIWAGAQLGVLATIVSWSREVLKDFEESKKEMWTLSSFIGATGAKIFAHLLLVLSIYNSVQLGKTMPLLNSLFMYLAGLFWFYGVVNFRNPTISQKMIKLGMASIILGLLLL